MKKREKPYISLFVKTLFLFAGILVLPLIITGISVNRSFSEDVKGTLLANLSQMTRYVGRGVSEVLEEMNENTKYVYQYGITEYDYFYELIQDTELTQTKKQRMVSEVLRSILSMNQYIEHVMLITTDGRQYTSMRPPEIMVNAAALKSWHESAEEKNQLIVPSHVSDYFFYSSVLTFSVARKIMNTATVRKAENEVLGTLYLDINVLLFRDLIEEADFGEQYQVMILDRDSGLYIYDSRDFNIGHDIGELRELAAQMTEDQTYMKTEDSYYIYSQIPDTGWVVVDQVPVEVIDASYENIQKNTLLILGLGTFLVTVMYILYSRMSNVPIRQLKQTMEMIQEGDLDARVRIKSNDELGTLAGGLNEMAAKLQSHIQRVYLAEIRQRDARLAALKMQIQPHYLYNTLDVIRMSAITHDDEETADMLDSLSAQLRYLIGTSKDRVRLGEEADSIRNYFKLVKVRFDNRFELEIHMPESLLQVEVPHLILQPVVENAIKHGLRPKTGEGKIALYAKEENGMLEITVMDSGIGMDEQALAKLRESLEAAESEEGTENNRESIGLFNVQNRIRLIYGEKYGLTIDSFRGIGTIVKYRLPIVTGGEEHV